MSEGSDFQIFVKVMLIASGIFAAIVACAMLFHMPFDHPELRGFALIIGYPCAMAASICMRYAFITQRRQEQIITPTGILGILISLWLTMPSRLAPLNNYVDERRIRDDLIAGGIALSLTLLFCLNWKAIFNHLKVREPCPSVAENSEVTSPASAINRSSSKIKLFLLIFAFFTLWAIDKMGIPSFVYVIGFCVLSWTVITVATKLNFAFVSPANNPTELSWATLFALKCFSTASGVALAYFSVYTLVRLQLNGDHLPFNTFVLGWLSAIGALVFLRSALKFTDFPARYWISQTGLLGLILGGWHLAMSTRLMLIHRPDFQDKFFYHGLGEAMLIWLTVLIFNTRWKMINFSMKNSSAIADERNTDN